MDWEIWFRFVRQRGHKADNKMSKKRTIRFSDNLDKFLEDHAEKNKRSFSKTVEFFVDLGKEKESEHLVYEK